MGMELELNWYLVTTVEPKRIDYGYWSEDLQDFDKSGSYYTLYKSGARIYPLGKVVPLIIKDQAVSLVHITEVKQILDEKGAVSTRIKFDIVLDFAEGDIVADHYTDMYLTYKEQQEAQDHGGTFTADSFINALERISFDRMLAKQRGEVNA